MPYLFLFSSRLLEWVRAAFRVSARPTLTIFTAMIMRMRYELASTCLTYRYIQTYKHTVQLVVLISVGLAQARPNYPRLIRYKLIRQCWEFEAVNRPQFADIVNAFLKSLGAMAGYMDISSLPSVGKLQSLS